NGKVDKRALPLLASPKGAELSLPKTVFEHQLAKQWSEVLSIALEDIGRESDFFALGGNSLKGMVLVSRLRKYHDIKLPLSTIFIHSSLKGQAAQILQSGPKDNVSIRPVEKKEYYPLSPAQKRLYT